MSRLVAGAAAALLLVACVKYTDADPANDSKSDDSTVTSTNDPKPASGGGAVSQAAADAGVATTDAGAVPAVDSGTPTGITTANLVPYDTTKLCNFDVTTCGDSITLNKCNRIYSVQLFTQDCVTKLDAAIAAGDCNEFKTGTTHTVCMPDCNGGVDTCNGDGTMNVCNQQNLFAVQDCNLECQQQGAVYSGTCGQDFEGRSTTEDVCWCTSN